MWEVALACHLAVLPPKRTFEILTANTAGDARIARFEMRFTTSLSARRAHKFDAPPPILSASQSLYRQNFLLPVYNGKI